MFRRYQPAAWTYHQHSSHADPLGEAAVEGRLRPSTAWPRRSPGARLVALPPTETLPPTEDGTAKVADRTWFDLLPERRSCRQFGGPAPSLAELATLLVGSYGPGPRGEAWVEAVPFVGSGRPVPSAGGAYPLELSVLARRLGGCEPGVYHFAPFENCLEAIRGPVPWAVVQRIFLQQSWLAECDLVIVASARLPIAVERYGERSYRYALLEAGHVGQCLLLAATALGLGSLPLGGFRDRQLGALLDLDGEVEVPLYAVAVGRWSPGQGAGESGSEGERGE